MTGKDQMQTMLNRLSLVMNLSEDIVKACKSANLPPAMVEILMRMHQQHQEMEKAINGIRDLMMQMAQSIEMSANASIGLNNQLADLREHTGFDHEEMTKAEDVGSKH